MKDEARYVLDAILADWHQWARGYLPVAGHGCCSMFAATKSSRQWDSENDATDASLHQSQMVSVNFQIDQLEPTYRTAIGINARNICTGRSVWTSARLPTDIHARAELLGRARDALTVRLVSAGVM